MNQTTFIIDAMHCGACTGRVERALSAETGVQDASANLMARSARVRFEAPATPASLATALEAAGYPPARAEALIRPEGDAAKAAEILAAQSGVFSVTPSDDGLQVSYAQGAIAPSELIRALQDAGITATLSSGGAAPAPVTEKQAAEAARLKRDVIASAALTTPVFVLAMGAHTIPGFHHAIMNSIGMQASWWIQFVLTALVLALPGRVFLRLGFPALLRGAPEMNSLVAMGASAAFLYSALVVLAPDLFPPEAREVYFEAAAVIVTLILVGRWLEARAKGRAGEAISRLVALRPSSARVQREDGVIELPVDELAPGDIVLLNP
ncbi:MAG: cation transporter, partial [Paracoccaceae bacterium]